MVRLVGWATVTGGGAAAACGAAGLLSQPDKVAASRTITGPRTLSERISTIRARRSVFSVALNSAPIAYFPRSIAASVYAEVKMISADSLFKTRRDQAKFAMRGGSAFKKIATLADRVGIIYPSPIL